MRDYCRRSAVVSRYVARGEGDKCTGSPLFSCTVVFRMLGNTELNFIFKKKKKKKKEKGKGKEKEKP